MAPAKPTTLAASEVAVRLGRVHPPYQWDTQTPHTVALMLHSTEEDLLLKSCQSLYKFAHEGEMNQQLLLEYDVLNQLLRHMRHTNKSVRRMAAMTLSALAGSAAVQKVLLLDGGVASLVTMLADDDDRVVQEFISAALLRIAADAGGKARLLQQGAIPALVKRLATADPDVIKNCLDSLLAIMDDFQAIEVFVAESGVDSCLALFDVQPPLLLSLALEALRRAMYVASGRRSIRDRGGLEQLLLLLETPGQEAQAARAVAVLEHATLDAQNVRAMSRNGGLLRMVQLSRGGDADADLLQQCGNVVSNLSADADCRRALHELGAEAVIVNTMLAAAAPAAQLGGAHAAASLSQLQQAQDLLVELGAVPPLMAMLATPETAQAAARALAAITLNNEAACKLTAENLSKLVEKVNREDEETAAYAAAAIANLAAQEATRPTVAGTKAVERLLGCLSDGSAPLLVAACDALAAVGLSFKARRTLVLSGGLQMLLELMQHADPAVGTSALRALQVSAADPAAGEQLCKPDIIGQLRRQRATSALRVVLQVNLPAFYSQFGRLGQQQIIADGFFDVGRQQADAEAVPEILAELERPLTPGRVVFLLNPGASPDVEAAEKEKEVEKKKRSPTPRRGAARNRRKESPTISEPAAPAQPQVPEDHRLATYISYVRASIMPLQDDREQAAQLGRFVAERLGGAVAPAALPAWSCEQHIDELRQHRGSNVVPVGELSRAGLRCRALLFKFLADHIFLPCTLSRGHYTKHWNSVLVAEPVAPPFSAPLSGAFGEVIVDLMHQPGTLMVCGSAAAVQYTTEL